MTIEPSSDSPTKTPSINQTLVPATVEEAATAVHLKRVPIAASALDRLSAIFKVPSPADGATADTSAAAYAALSTRIK